jgi:adenylate cyclase class 2
LTFKGPSENSNGVLSRTELETTVGDLETAQHIFEALGYSQILTYEKYRTIYEILGCHIMLDELPFGDFVEIEASDGGSIRNLVAQMSLDIKNAVNRGYASLFEIYNSKYGFTSGDLTFDSFHEKKPSPEELNVRAADN